MGRECADKPKARQRDRYRVALLAIGGEKKDITKLLSVPASVVEEWAYRRRDHGIGALRPRNQPGRKPTLPRERHAEFKARMKAGPREADGVSTLRCKDVARIFNEEFNAPYMPNGVYGLMHRLNLSCLTPRPRHEKNDPGAMEEIKKIAPFFCAEGHD